MALVTVNPGVKLQQIEVSAPDSMGQMNVTISYSMRSGYKVRPGAINGSTPGPENEGFLNTLFADINEEYTAFTT